jgi:hypothetical protein
MLHIRLHQGFTKKVTLVMMLWRLGLNRHYYQVSTPIRTIRVEEKSFAGRIILQLHIHDKLWEFSGPFVTYKNLNFL